MDESTTTTKPRYEGGHVGPSYQSRSDSESKEFAARQAERGAEAYAHTKETLSNAYTKTSDAFNHTYEWMVAYSQEHPGRTMLMAFGAGAGIGFLLGSNGRAARRPSAYVEPVVNAISQFASEVFRRR